MSGILQSEVAEGENGLRLEVQGILLSYHLGELSADTAYEALKPVFYRNAPVGRPFLSQVQKIELPPDTSPVAISMLQAVKHAQPVAYNARRAMLEADEAARRMGRRLPVHYDSSPALTADERAFFGSRSSTSTVLWKDLVDALLGKSYTGVKKQTQRFLSVIDGREYFGVTLENYESCSLTYWTAIHAWRCYHACLVANKRDNANAGRKKMVKAIRVKNLKNQRQKG